MALAPFIPLMLIAGLFAALLCYSVQGRRTRGEPLRPAPPVDAWFCESWASGYGSWGRHANNCLLVCVTQRELWITPHFPFNLFLPSGWLGLEYRLPKSAVRGAVRLRSMFGPNVRLELLPPGGDRTRTISLRLRNPDGFIAALGK